MDTIESIKQNIRLMELKADQLDIPKNTPFFILKDKTINELVLIETSLKLQLATYYINKMNRNYINTFRKMSMIPLDLDTITNSKMSMRDIELYYYHFNLDYKYSVLARDLPNHKVADSYLATTDDLEVNYMNMLNSRPKPMFHVDSLYSFIKNRR